MPGTYNEFKDQSFYPNNIRVSIMYIHFVLDNCMNAHLIQFV